MWFDLFVDDTLSFLLQNSLNLTGSNYCDLMTAGPVQRRAIKPSP
jgi:hypothetical protein